MDYSKKTQKELITLCQEAVPKIKGYSGKKKDELIALLNNANMIITTPVVQPTAHEEPTAYALEKDKPYLKSFLDARRTTKGFKRMISSPLRYAGGKSKAIGIILDHLPALKSKKIVSPFFGGGSFELALSTHLGFEVIGYDVFGMLTNFWNMIISNPEGLAAALAPLKAVKDDYTRNRHILLNYWEKIKPADLHYETKNRLALTDAEKVLLDDSPLIQAAYYYYNMQLSYGPMFLGWPSSVYMKEPTYKEILARVKAFKPGNVKVACDSFENVIVNHPDDFLFLDPPYYLGNDSKMFKGMYPNCNFAIHHNSFNHELLADLLKKHKGGFFITYNDCPTIREFYKEYKQVFPSWKYTYGQGEKRIGKNRKTGTQNNVKESHEIFIICPPVIDTL
jgi:DNA adenine methylase